MHPDAPRSATKCHLVHRDALCNFSGTTSCLGNGGLLETRRSLREIDAVRQVTALGKTTCGKWYGEEVMAAVELWAGHNDEGTGTTCTIERLVDFTRQDVNQNGLSAAQSARATAASEAQLSSGLGDRSGCPGSVQRSISNNRGIQSIGWFASEASTEVADPRAMVWVVLVCTLVYMARPLLRVRICRIAEEPRYADNPHCS